VVELSRRRAREAASAFEEAIRLDPDDVAALSNLGSALRHLEQWDRAEACCRQALALRPGHTEALLNLANIVRARMRMEEAIVLYRSVLKGRPDFALAHMNLGTALRELGRLEESEASLREAIRPGPGVAVAHMNLGNTLRDLDRFDEADASYREALRLQPDYAQAHYCLGYLRLLTGDYSRGWDGYEWRWRCEDHHFPRYPAFSTPAWDGAALDGGTILLFAEQGLGDTIQFVRFAKRVKERGGTVVLRCHRSLATLLARSPGVDRVSVWEERVPRHDVHAALMSVPWILRTPLADVPAEVPYVRADEGLVARWRREVRADSDGLRVGILWQGNLDNPVDHHRSFPLAQFTPLAAVPAVRLYALQCGPGREQVASNADRFPLVDLSEQLGEGFEGTAAVMRTLDLVIAPDTAGAHLAGALGVPVWIPLARKHEWRWLPDREDSPWYPTVRIFRQSLQGRWDDVFARMAAALREQRQLGGA
jgi:Flp pilus assembly protein TadD